VGGDYSSNSEELDIALKPKSIKNLKALQSNAFRFFIVVRLIGNCCKKPYWV